MMLFDARDWTDSQPAGYSEPMFAYLNRSASPDCECARQMLETWFANFPDVAKEELRTRFRSEDDYNHNGAFFELYCYSLMAKQGFAVQVHPDLDGGKRTHPDFVASLAGAEVLYLESTVAASRDHKEQSYLHQLYDYLNRTIRAPDFFLRVSVMGDVPKKLPLMSAVRKEVQTWLSGLDPDEVQLQAAQTMAGGHTLDALPTKVIKQGGWHIEFEAIPISREHRGDPDHPVVGVIYRIPTSMWIDTQKPILPALRKKARDYGQLNLPYVIAVNSQDFADTDDIASVLFGKQGVRINTVTGEGTPMYFPNGLWTARGGQYWRVSAVLITSGLGPQNVGRQQPWLWHNPWATFPLDPALWSGPQMVPDPASKTMVERPGTPVWEILDVPLGLRG